MFSTHINSLFLGKMRGMGHNKIVILVTAGLLLLSGIFFYTVHKNSEEYQLGVSSEIVVEQTWKLPEELREVSGIAFLAPNSIACVQDEKGIIFIYDLKSSAIVKQIKFAGSGDFEGLAINGRTAYVQTAEGKIFRINDFQGEATVDIFETQFSSKNDIESLFFDPAENRLLLMPKDRGLKGETKGIYSIDVNTMKMKREPLFKLTFEEKMFDDLKGKEKNRSYYPAEIARDPKTGNYLVLEAKKPHLLIVNAKGTPEELHRLDPNVFPQPEGLTFDDSGNLYISNEGNPGTIHRVSIKRN